MPGKKWKKNAGFFLQRLDPARRWLRFADGIDTRYSAAAARFEPLKERVRGENPQLEVEADQDQDLAGLLDQLLTGPRLQEPDPVPELERSSHAMLDGRLQRMLAGILDIRIPAVKIYTNQAADTIARQHDADAVTYGDKIFFRAGKYDRRDPAGLALLGHELTHAARAHTDPQGVAAQTRADQENQEQEALRNEARVLDALTPAPARPEAPTASPPHRTPLPWTGKTLLARNRTRIINELAVGGGNLSPANVSSGFGPQGSPSAAPVQHLTRHQPGQTAHAGNRSALQSGPIKTASSKRELNSAPQAGGSPNGPSQLTTQQLEMIKEEVYRDLMNRIRTDFERGG